eukprot:TRINITY_DN7510_c0_g1_i1.p2 TRINITY_DN7510_c0_g1~~TRINITY_DN7510_c0_g1_i1.p2  ORF type:complete len:57 (-),score=2.33 TRINITY_DN7510_c0_g1_i1:22-192(-)
MKTKYLLRVILEPQFVVLITFLVNVNNTRKTRFTGSLLLVSKNKGCSFIKHPPCGR